jgi:hypothetical protein
MGNVRWEMGDKTMVLCCERGEAIREDKKNRRKKREIAYMRRNEKWTDKPKSQK